MTEHPFPHVTIGNYAITALSDGYLTASLDLLVNIDQDEASELHRRSGSHDHSPMHINSYLLHGNGHVALVDAGAGGVKQWGGELEERLPLAGVQRSDVDTILLTHAHPDHIGGLTDIAGRATFPNAELVIDDREVAFWRDDANLAHASERARGNFQIARRALDAYADRLRSFTANEALPGIEAVPLHGHTTGHTGYLVGGPARSMLFWGDTVHFPLIQAARPEASVILDNDPVGAAASRLKTLEMASAEHLLVAGAHLNERGFARVARSKNGYVITYED
ncbi:MBL fold metallo-hydrolase [Planosporangium thailandense]|uniref:MBL fold metallo-hydrolase n=1 Tax=Planosporangium thailandense TaxID=765197 RepID=A0ABX0XVI2_9ACTN|nr:MBL fold metallo-hydrolase [Planosporangium thailandense]NJC70037.1 MBL fold metallo-hydrolase [Planosporangium thailandense]